MQNGINVISYYAPLVFESAGWIGRDALLMTGINAMGSCHVLPACSKWTEFVRHSLHRLDDSHVVSRRRRWTKANSALWSCRAFFPLHWLCE